MTQENTGAGTIFVDVLWAMVVLVGCSVSVGGMMVAYRHFKSGGGGAPMYLPVQAMVSRPLKATCQLEQARRTDPQNCGIVARCADAKREPTVWWH